MNDLSPDMLPITPSLRLEGKRALVTGASSGIGLACASSLAQAGAEVTLAARTESKLIRLSELFRQKSWKSSICVLDVSNIKAIEAQLESEPAFDVLVNSAGMARHGAALQTTEADFDAVVDLNLKGAFFLSKSVAAGMIAQKKLGSIINISSQMAHVGGIDRAVYCATKHAVEGFTKSMAIEWGPKGIRINTICPTFIRTDLTQSTFDDPEKAAWINEKIKLDKVGEVEDLMGAVQFLASDAASLITGTSLLVDGGWTAG